jgi:hypothetical protein
MKRSDWRMAAALVAGPLLLLAAMAATGAGPVDDAFIFARFGENLAAGHGFRFNPSGPRVEGFSSPLFTLLVAGAVGMGLPAMAAATGLSVAATAGTGLVIARAGPTGPGAAVVYLACPAVAYWGFSAMDAPLLALSVALVGVAMARGVRPFLLGLLAGGALWVRPEGLGVVLPWVLVSVALWPPEGTPRGRALVGVALGASLPAVLLFAARWALFGEIFPNTYYAKVVLTLGERLAFGARYLYAQAFALPGVGLVGALLVAAAFRPGAGGGTGPRRQIPCRLLLGVGVLALYTLYVGGDHFAWARFLLPGIALVAVGLAQVDLAARAPALRVAFVPLLVVLGAAGLWSEQRRKGGNEVRMAAAWYRVGEHLRRTEPPGTRLAVIAAGATPYASGFEAFDMLGLVSPEVVHGGAVAREADPGHQRYHTAAVKAFAPHLFVYPMSGRFDTPRWPSARDIDRRFCYALAVAAVDPEVSRDYAYEAHPLPDGTWLEMLRRRPTATD